MPHNIAITSADGQTGHLVAELLLSDTFASKLGGPLTCLTYDPSKVKDLEELGAVIVPMPSSSTSESGKKPTKSASAAATKKAHESLVASLEDSKVDTIMVIPPARDGKVELTKQLVEAAKEAGVQNVLLLSAAGCDFADPKEQPILRSFIEIERMVMECKGDADVPLGHSPCILRAGMYAETLLLLAKQAQAEGALRLPIGPTHKCAPVALGDVALVAATVLTGEGDKGFHDDHRGQLITLTGPIMTAGNELVEAMEESIGVKLKFQDVKPEEAKKMLTNTSDVDPSEIEYLMEIFALARKGFLNYISTTAFIALTGQKPQELTEFFKTYSDEFSNKRRKTGKTDTKEE
ncbi:hypothetical protein HDU86_006552 [Geranomyces michiganensis]|nr:hypothetical protein HDU86_006552 [Geranomyces michiganensis]